MKSVKISALLDERDNIQFNLSKSFKDAHIKNNRTTLSLVAEGVTLILIRIMLLSFISTGLTWAFFQYVTGWEFYQLINDAFLKILGF